MEKTPGPWFANGSTSGAIVAPCPAFRHQSSTRGARCIGLRPRFGDVLAAGTESRRSWLAGESSSNGGPRASARQLGTCEFLLRVTLRTKETFGLRGWQWRQWGKRPTGASFLGALSSTWRSPAAGLPILLLSIPYSSGLTLPARSYREVEAERGLRFDHAQMEVGSTQASTDDYYQFHNTRRTGNDDNYGSGNMRLSYALPRSRLRQG
jgi:hypothetical protein